MLDLVKYDQLRESQPYFYYQRVSLAAPVGYFFQAIDYGFWYFMRRVHCIYPEIDAGGVNFSPVDIRVEFNLRASNKWPQNVPIPFRLFSTPGCNGVQIAAGGQKTAVSPRNVKLINCLYPYRDNIELYITGQNAALPGSPPHIDVVCMGYLIPVDKLQMWEGGGNA